MDILTVEQVAARLRVSIKTARSYVASGILTGRKVGKRWLVHEQALTDFLMNGDQTANGRRQTIDRQ